MQTFGIILSLSINYVIYSHLLLLLLHQKLNHVDVDLIRFGGEFWMLWHQQQQQAQHRANRQPRRKKIRVTNLRNRASSELTCTILNSTVLSTETDDLFFAFNFNLSITPTLQGSGMRLAEQYYTPWRVFCSLWWLFMDSELLFKHIVCPLQQYIQQLTTNELDFTLISLKHIICLMPSTFLWQKKCFVMCVYLNVHRQ